MMVYSSESLFDRALNKNYMTELLKQLEATLKPKKI